MFKVSHIRTDGTAHSIEVSGWGDEQAAYRIFGELKSNNNIQYAVILENCGHADWDVVNQHTKVIN